MASESSPRAAGPASLIRRTVGVLDRIPHALIALLARFSVGMVFLNSGLTKVEGFQVSESAVYLFREEYRLPFLPPELAAHLAAAIELTMPWLLFAGLGARFAALVLLAMTLVIQIFVYPSAYVTHGLWAAALLLIVARGAGALSLDNLIARWSRGS
jgi:putative oxidoreductase